MKEIIVPSLAIIAIAMVSAYSLYLGHDGELVLLSLQAIAGLAGYIVGKRTTPVKTPPASSIASTEK